MGVFNKIIDSRFIPISIGSAVIVLLYTPLIVLIVYSFNASRRVAIWTGWSTQWYERLLENKQIINAASLSLQIGVASATIGTIIGTMGAYALVRFTKFPGKTVLSASLTAPLVMPEVITGLSLLLTFIAFEQLTGWPQGRGVTTIIIAHSTFCAAYVSVVVSGRLSAVDKDLEDAAQDLGARPYQVFWDITLPIIRPAIIAGWLLAFTLSLDDLVIASFTSGPKSSTLPIEVFSKVKFGVTPEINALASLIIITVASGVLITWLIVRHYEKDRSSTIDR